MKDLFVVAAFLLMVISPCLVAMSTGIHEGSDADNSDSGEWEDQ